MKLFKLVPGTACHVIQDGKEWTPGNLLSHETEKELVFCMEDIRVDPIGKIGCHRGFIKTIGGSYAENGYYAFIHESSGWIVIVHANDVIVL